MRPTPLLTAFEPKRKSPRVRRPVKLSRVTAWIAALCFLVLAGWSVATLMYFMSQDEVALRLLEKQARLKHSYEAEIRSLRAKSELAGHQREAARESLESRLSALLQRQASFEKRAAVVRTISERAGVEVISLAEPATTGSAPAVVIPGIPGASAYAPAPKQAESSPFQLRLRSIDPQPAAKPQVQSLEDGLDQANRNLASLELHQLHALENLMRSAQEQTAVLRTAFRSAGVDPSKLDQHEAAVGGPIVPVSGNAGPFENLALRADASISRMQSLRRAATGLPFGEPMNGDLELSSGFGYRIDPFTRTPALHTGLDLKAEAGSPVRATGSGRVVTAEWSGAYGNMVEIEHSNGVTSRYGHLSAILVSVGQTIPLGGIVGRVGSTGRSTGPHLHYETRIDGDSVDPTRFLRAGTQMEAVASASR
jgi:murein DD-endopeptidase MepM/ murein hydrolase activator NlpD